MTPAQTPEPEREVAQPSPLPATASREINQRRALLENSELLRALRGL